MNAIVSIETLTPATVFVPGGVEAIISKVEAEVRAIDRDISTPEGREAVKSLAYKVARSKTALDEMGKDLVAGIKAQAAAIDADRRTIRDRLDALKEEVRGPLTAWEEAEAKRVADHESALVWIVSSPRSLPPGAPSCLIREQIERVSHYAAHDWQEFKERGDAAVADALHTLGEMKVAAKQREADHAELAELRRLKAEREDADRLAAIAAERAEREKAAAIAKAQREEAEKAAAEQRAKDLAERIERERVEAAAEAVRQENQRVAEAHAKTEADRIKRENNTKHRAKVHAKIGTALVALFGNEPTAEDATMVFTVVEAIAAGTIPHVSITY